MWFTTCQQRGESTAMAMTHSSFIVPSPCCGSSRLNIVAHPLSPHASLRPSGEVVGYYGKAFKGLGQAKRIKEAVAGEGVASDIGGCVAATSDTLMQWPGFGKGTVCRGNLRVPRQVWDLRADDDLWYEHV